MKYIIGIDLGTTNCTLSYVEAAAEPGGATVRTLPIPQAVAADTTEARSTLPSFLYVGETGDGGKSNTVSPDIGEWARRRSAEQPERVVCVAKSWLCNGKVDRRAPILPWEAPEEVAKISPLTASCRYLEHLIGAWNAAFPGDPFAEQQVVLTVPASFDAGARDLTREAAIGAGIPIDRLLFLEEPQAAVYAWLAGVGDGWRQMLTVDDTILVCDIGGGTTDLSLVTVRNEGGDLVLDRFAVGDHLLVGGDNMDLALAHHVAGRFTEQGTALDPWQSVALWHSCRTAKEALLGDPPASPTGRSESARRSHTISVLGRGRKLIGGTLSLELERDAAAELLLEGFLPRCALEAKPRRRMLAGFRELGLPFEQETGITRHLAAFLTRHGGEPTHLLLNGGVFKSRCFADRLRSVLDAWFPGQQSGPGIRMLDAASDLDHAVSRGAAFYGWTKRHGGVRIRGGIARSYYVGIETAGLAIPGAPRPVKGLCVAPIGMEEGTQTPVPGGEIGVIVGEEAHFRIFSSTSRKQDKPGDLLDAPFFASAIRDDEIQETDSMETLLPPEPGMEEDNDIAVRFRTCISELGVMELWCDAADGEGRWKLEFSVRPTP